MNHQHHQHGIPAEDGHARHAAPESMARHERHTGHASMVDDFRRRFWISLALTLPVLMAGFSGGDTGVDWGGMPASGALVILPVLIFSLAAQRHLVAGLSSGAVKGCPTNNGRRACPG